MPSCFPLFCYSDDSEVAAVSHQSSCQQPDVKVVHRKQSITSTISPSTSSIQLIDKNRGQLPNSCQSSLIQSKTVQFSPSQTALRTTANNAVQTLNSNIPYDQPQTNRTTRTNSIDAVKEEQNQQTEQEQHQHESQAEDEQQHTDNSSSPLSSSSSSSIHPDNNNNKNNKNNIVHTSNAISAAAAAATQRLTKADPHASSSQSQLLKSCSSFPSVATSISPPRVSPPLPPPHPNTRKKIQPPAPTLLGGIPTQPKSITPQRRGSTSQITQTATTTTTGTLKSTASEQPDFKRAHSLPNNNNQQNKNSHMYSSSPSPSSSQSQSYNASPTPSIKARSTPLRARRLQRHRALTNVSPHCTSYNRPTVISSSPSLSAFFASPSAITMMTNRLTAGGFFQHHDQYSKTVSYKHVYCNSDLTRLFYVDMMPNINNSHDNGNQPHLIASTITKVTKGISTKSLIHKHVELEESQRPTLSSSLFVSVVSPTISLDLECLNECDRDEWYATFDFLLEWWNQCRTLKEERDKEGALLPGKHSAMLMTMDKMENGEKKRKSSLIQSIVNLYQEQEHLQRSAPIESHPTYSPPDPFLLIEPRRSLSYTNYCQSNPSSARVLHSSTSPHLFHPRASSCNSTPVLPPAQLHQLMNLFINDIEHVREINRSHLIEGCSTMMALQQQIDSLRQKNAQLIEEISV